MDEEKADVSTVQQRVLCRSWTLTRSREMVQIDKTCSVTLFTVYVMCYLVEFHEVETLGPQ